MTDQCSQAPEASRSAARTGVRLPWRGLGLWNVYFILKFVLAYYGYINLDVLCNALLLGAMLVPIRAKWLSALRDLLGLAAALALIYSESWLPGIDSIMSNAANIRGFSWNYIAELAFDFINWRMVGWAALAVGLWYLLRNCIRITFLTVCYFVVMVTMPYIDAFRTENSETASAANDSEEVSGKAAPSSEVAEWYKAFVDYEKDRRAEMPMALGDKDTPFDILILNICSLSNDDLAASQLEAHPVLNRFNIRFDHFNSATAYSGPAAIRLLTGACGQPSHNGLYGERRPECELMSRLDSLGYTQSVMMDHSGEYDNFLQNLRDTAGLKGDLAPRTTNPVRYIGFDDEPISDDLSVLRQWLRTTSRSKIKRNVTFMNFIALHDGNRLPRHERAEPFKPRAQQMLDDLGAFLRELDKSGRKVMVIAVPEHGAAVRGDRIQTARLRDIPSLRITEVPVLVKFTGIKGLPDEPIHVTGNTSYLALSTLIGNVLRDNYFSKKGGAVPLEDLVKDLPLTNRVSENAQAQVLEYKGREYLRRDGGDWVPYVK